MNYEISIQNLKCGGCAKTIIRELEKINGILSVKINLEDHMVKLEVTETPVVLRAYEALKDMGYPPEGKRITWVQKQSLF